MSRILYIARHGETDWNAAERWQGHTDVPLNTTGRAQAMELAEKLMGARLGAVVSSDLARARETAHIVGEHLGVPHAWADADLRERAFGLFEGLTREECERLHPEAWRAHLEQQQPPEGAESHESLRSRMLRAVERVFSDEALFGTDMGAVLAVSHGGAIRALIVSITGKRPDPLANGELWVVTRHRGVLAAERAARPGDNDSSG
jgi:probable phosphoglycerate mutase